MLSKLTMIGLHEYSDGHLWDNVVLPEGMDASIFINECLRQGGEFPVLYADLDFMKMQIGEFCQKWSKTFDRWWKAYNFEYEALFNLDVKSTITEDGTNSGSDTKNSSGTNTSGKNTSGRIDSSNGGTNTHSKAAYDSGTFQNTDQDVTSSSNNTTYSDNENVSGTNTLTESGTNSSNHHITTEEWRRGNQGVTQSQELLLAEYNAWMYNIYSHMAEVFINEMCICIYI